jgi:prephenate dehydrogenase
MRSLGIVGLGLIGGSLALCARRHPDRPTIVAIEPREEIRRAALEAKVVDEAHAAPGPVLGVCDLVVLCAPVGIIERLLGPVSSFMADGSVLTDVAGVKRAIIEAATREVRSAVRFVGAHPMFGGERGGFEARAARWPGGVVAVCEDSTDPSALVAVEEFHRALGATVVRTTADAHDAAVAVVSHLPYVVASALAGLASADPLALSLAGRGFADATRLSGFAFEVQGEVARRNPHLRGAIDRLIARLREVEASLDEQDAARRALGAR